MMLVGGFVMIIFLVFLNTSAENAYLHGIYSMLEPVGWFMTWTGLDHIFQNSRKAKSNLHYNSMMAHARIAFSSFDTAITSAATEEVVTKQKTVIPFDDCNLRVA